MNYLQPHSFPDVHPLATYQRISMSTNFNFSFLGDDIDDDSPSADFSLPGNGPQANTPSPAGLIEPRLHTLEELVSI